MKKLSALVAIALLAWMLPSVQAAARANADASQIIVELGDAVTMGNFDYGDASIDVSTEWFNPRGSVEYCFGGTPFAIGGEYAQSKNTFDGTYQDSYGNLDVKRTEYLAFVRLGHKDRTNFRLGYRNFKYDFSNGTVHQNGETDTDGTATGKLATGIDAELNLAMGSDVQFALAIGGTYFTGAKYDWSYLNGAGTRVSDNAKLDAYSARLRPEISFKAGDNLRIFINYMVQVSTWEAQAEGSPDYAGVDIYAAAAAGIRYTFGL